jgi:ankyrin repeat protein
MSETDLENAIKNGDIIEIKLLTNKLNVKKHDILASATYYGHIEVVRYLISLDCDLESRNKALIVGAQCDHFEIVKYLISVGADPRTQEDFALIYSAENGNMEMLKYFIGLGCNIWSQYSKALKYGAKNGHIDIVRYLVSLGGYDSEDVIDHALRFSAYNGHIDVLDYLISLGSDVRNQRDKPLIFSACNGHLHMVKHLISLGCDVASQKYLVLIKSIEYGHFNLAKFLISYGCPVSTHALCWAYTQRRYDIQKFLMSSMEKDIYRIDKNFHDDNLVLEIMSKKLSTEKITKKVNLFKYILKPKSLRMQMYFI